MRTGTDAIHGQNDIAGLRNHYAQGVKDSLNTKDTRVTKEK
jgi:hypothetical protein